MVASATPGHSRPRGGGRVYAIAFDFDTELLEQLYPNASWRNANSDVGNFLSDNGFEQKQGLLYFGDPELTGTECVVIVQGMAEAFPWFTPALKDIRMLRIDENNDLMPALNRKRRSGGRKVV